MWRKNLVHQDDPGRLSMNRGKEKGWTQNQYIRLISRADPIRTCPRLLYSRTEKTSMSIHLSQTSMIIKKNRKTVF